MDTGNLRDHKKTKQYQYKLVRTGEVSIHIRSSTTWKDLDPNCMDGVDPDMFDAEQLETEAFAQWVADLASSDSEKEEAT